MMPVVYRCVFEACGLLRLVIGALVATSQNHGTGFSILPINWRPETAFSPLMDRYDIF
jgi:hypothetical protein